MVTTGVFGIARHPSYLGWFLWAIGTQVMLLNPFSVLLFFYASWVFFSRRIDIEEEILIEFFEMEYIEYAVKTPIWIPFVKGN